MGAGLLPPKQVPLSAEDREKQLAAVAKMDASYIPKFIDFENNPNLRVYVVAFDGTGNDRNDLGSDQQATIPAVLEQNLALVYGRETDPSLGAGRFASQYYPGVGTVYDNKVANFFDSLLSFSDDEILERALADFQKQAKIWVENNPDVEIYVVTTGFSRGAAIARNFMNEVDNVGIPSNPDPEAWEKATPQERQSDGYYLRAPGEVRMSAILFDTVSTAMTVRNLAIPDSADYVVHLVSDNDKRFITFRADSILENETQTNDPRLKEIRLPGVHTDIANGYKNIERNEVQVRTLGSSNEDLAVSVVERLGLSKIREAHPAQCRNLEWVEHDSRFFLSRFLESLPIVDKVYDAIEPNSRNIEYTGQNEPLSEQRREESLNRLLNRTPAMTRDPAMGPAGILDKEPEQKNMSLPLKSEPLSELLHEHGKTHGISSLTEKNSKELAQALVEGIKAGALDSTEVVAFSKQPNSSTPIGIYENAQEALACPNNVALIPASTLVKAASHTINEAALAQIKTEMKLPTSQYSTLDVISVVSGAASKAELEQPALNAAGKDKGIELEPHVQAPANQRQASLASDAAQKDKAGNSFEMM